MASDFFETLITTGVVGLVTGGAGMAVVNYFLNKRQNNATAAKTEAEMVLTSFQAQKEIYEGAKIRDGLKDSVISEWQLLAKSFSERFQDTLNRLTQVEKKLESEITERYECRRQLSELQMEFAELKRKSS